MYFKIHRQRCYELLDRVRTGGDWEAWLEFFLEGVKETAEQAAATVRQILSLFEADERRIEGLGRAAASALRVPEFARTNPILPIPALAQKLGISAPTVAKSIAHLRRMGILREITGKPRGRIFAYREYLEILNRGM
ncbi:MAG: winged helix-turn-helix transcriptional regulator [Bryobacteraceae bacterium]